MRPVPAHLRADYGYLPALDGLRAVSILLVVISHAGRGIEKMVPGGLGVLVFFVISGFLITRQMIAEIEARGTLNLRRFYLRRIIRLAPALLLYIVTFSLILGSLGAVITPTHMLTGLFYLANYYHIFIGYPAYSPFPIIWSLSVEEHFYILFPFVMLAFRRSLPKLLPWLLLVLAATLAWRYALYGICETDPSRAICGLPANSRLHGTDTLFDCILYGSALSLLMQYRLNLIQIYVLKPLSLWVSFGVLLFTLLYRDAEFRDTVRFSLQSAAVAVVIINVLFGTDRLSSVLRRVLAMPPLVLIGKLSYSLYLFHFGMINWLMATGHFEGVSGFALYLTGSLLCALASYSLVEKPAARLRKRFGSHNKD